MDTNTTESSALESVRKVGAFVISWLFWFGTIAFVVVAGSYYLTLLNRLVEAASTIRGQFGFPVPEGPDWVSIAALILGTGLPFVCVVALYLSYRKYWSRRLHAVWGSELPRKRITLLSPLSRSASSKECLLRQTYLRSLLATPNWLQRNNSELSLPHEPNPAVYRQVAEEVLRQLEEEIVKRSLTTGLVVGISRNRVLDQVTIAIAALEMQLFVLTELGKRPSLRTWIEVGKRTAASLFVNSYLSREECSNLTLVVTAGAMGIEAVAEVPEHIGDLIDDVDIDELIPSGGWAELVKGAVHVVGTGLTVGAVGLRRIATMIDKHSTDLLEAILASTILYYQGIDLAARCLSLDEQHYFGKVMNRSVNELAITVAVSVGHMFRNQVQQFRALLREKQKDTVRLAKDVVSTKTSEAWTKLRSSVGRHPKRESNPSSMPSTKDGA